MTYTQSDLDMANRHVAEGERHVAMQEELVSRLRLRNQSAAEAEALLALFNATLAQHRTHRDKIEAAVRGAV